MKQTIQLLEYAMETPISMTSVASGTIHRGMPGGAVFDKQ
jgi:hypothetical protein